MMVTVRDGNTDEESRRRRSARLAGTRNFSRTPGRQSLESSFRFTFGRPVNEERTDGRMFNQLLVARSDPRHLSQRPNAPTGAGAQALAPVGSVDPLVAALSVSLYSRSISCS